MITQVSIASVVIGVVGGFCGWYELWHLTIGFPLLVGEGFIVRWWHQRTQLDGEEETVEEDREGFAHQVLMGALGGGLSLLLLTGTFSAAARLVPERHCPELLAELRILEGAEAHKRIIQLVDERLPHAVSSVCHRELAERKLRALLALTGQVEGNEGIAMLQQTRREAERIGHQDLLRLTTARLEAAEHKQQAAAYAQTVAGLQRTLETQQEEIERNKLLKQRLEASQLSAQETEHGVVVPIADVLFDPGKADLADAARATVQRIADILNQDDVRDRKIRIEGFSDATGSAETNQKLSEDRAHSVAQALMGFGVSQERLVMRGYGASRFVDTNDTPTGRAKNRRVEVIIEN